MTRAAAADFAERLIVRGVGEPLLLVHGALADGRIWQPVVERLAPHFQVHVFTQRYFGPGDELGAPPLDPSTISRVALYILDKQEGPFQLVVSSIDSSS